MRSRSATRTFGQIFLLLALGGAQVSSGAEIEKQRELFIDVFAAVERGDWTPVESLPAQDQDLLSRYVLWPDLRAVFFRATMRSAESNKIEQFLEEYGTLKPARDLRYHYALHKVKKGELSQYLGIYQQFYQGLEDERLDCLALQAELEAGRDKRIINRALDLWAVGHSQVSECDPVFTYLLSNNLIGPADYAKRYVLAIESREFSLARWLAKSIDQKHIDEAAEWQKARSSPEGFVRSHAQSPDNATTRAQLAYAIERITYADPKLAQNLLGDLVKRYKFSLEQLYQTERHIALWAARDDLSGAYELLTRLPKAAQNDEVLRWRARSSIRSEQWKNLLEDIAAMPANERNAEEWKYWRAVALQRNGQVIAAAQMLEELATERSYYGFLAADDLGRDYVFDDIESAADETIIAKLEKRPEMIRARELFLVGLESRGRSEWDTTVGYFGAREKQQAAILANRWGWHSRAISTAANAGQYDDLSLRYPLPYRDLFQKFAADASIPSTWAYGIARSESLFMRDVRSSAGAIGLMQLMPATGKAVARDIKLAYSGLDTLTNPSSNIRLGTTYLSQMANRFDGNRVLATAAYNAGPHRVDQWLPDQGAVDARVWIENIPFNETRKYVRRVLAAATIFHWRMTGETRRLSDELTSVEATPKSQQLALR